MATKCTKWRASLLRIKALIHGIKNFPETTPKRWSLISKFVCLSGTDKEQEDIEYPLAKEEMAQEVSLATPLSRTILYVD